MPVELVFARQERPVGLSTLEQVRALRDEAQQAVAAAAVRDFRDVEALLANATLAYGPGAAQVQAGDIITTQAEGFSYRVAASGAADHHLTTAGGVKLYVLPGADGAFSAEAFRLVKDGTTSDGAAINRAIAAAFAAGGGTVLLPPVVMATSVAIRPLSGVSLVGTPGKTEMRAIASMTGVLHGSTATKGCTFQGIRFNANSRPGTGAVQMNQARFEDITFRDCEFVNTAPTWTVLIGYATGSAANPGNATTALATKSRNILFEKCLFKGHASSTLEQFIIVNSEDVTVRGCTFDENENATNSILVYAFCRNIRIEGNTFLNILDKGVGVQESDDVWITQNRFEGRTTMAGRFINLMNCARVWVLDNRVKATKAGNSKFVAGYAFKGTHYESGNYLAQYQGCYDITVRGNKVDGCYVVAEIPQQKQLDKTFVFEGIDISGNTAKNCGGAPVILGNYSVLDAATQSQSIKRVRVQNNTIEDFDGFNEGWLYVVGTAAAPITDLIVSGNTAPVPATGTNAHGMRLSYIDDFQISGESVYGKGSRAAIKTENEGTGTITANNTHGGGVDFSANRPVHVAGNLGATAIMERHLLYVQNTHGATIPAGSPVILKAVAAQNQVTMTGTPGDYRAIGVALADIPNTAWGWIVVKGRVSNLRANGASAIAVGDLLSTFNAIGIAQKAAAGHTAFAMAGEAYATADSAGVLDALVIAPRLT